MWILLTLIAISVGIFAFVIHTLVHLIQFMKFSFVGYLLAENFYRVAFVVSVLFTVVLTGISALLITKVEVQSKCLKS
jgi:hypothetical protein